jgi:hypothetical protein
VCDYLSTRSLVRQIRSTTKEAISRFSPSFDISQHLTIFVGLEQDRVKPDRVGTLQEGFHALVGGHSRGIATAKLSH